MMVQNKTWASRAKPLMWMKLISMILVLYTLYCLQTKAIVEFTITNYQQTLKSVQSGNRPLFKILRVPFQTAILIYLIYELDIYGVC